jgi:hypothetical protein
LAGDFNARTAELKYFSVFTENDFPNGDEYLGNNHLTNVDDTSTQNTKAIPPDFLCENFCLFFVLNIYPGKLI